MSTLGTFTITTGTDTQTVDWERIDLVRYEQQFAKSSGALDGMLDQYRMAWLALRRAKVNGTPDTFDAWLDLSPDVDLEVEEAPKDPNGETEASSTSSPA